MLKTRFLLVALTLFSLSHSSFANETKSTSADQRSLYMTVYNGGRALIRDERQFELNESMSNIAFMDVAEKIMPQTVAIKGLDVLEQNYDFDLLTPQALVEKNIGNTVRIARRSSDSGETLEWTEGKILSTNGGVVLKMKDGSLESLSGLSNYHMVFDEVPDNLRTSPTLSLLLKQPVKGKQQVEMTYLTTGLSWQSDYVLQLDKTETSASLISWITLRNQSGIGYHNAHLQLLAGDVNLQQPGHRDMARAEMMMASRQAIKDVSEQALHGYHLYTVPHQTTIKNKQSKQIKLFSASEIPVHKKLEDRAYVNAQGINIQKSKPDQLLKFNNAKPSLGLPLPKGTMRVYAKDDQGRQQFIGEDGIDHSALNDDIEIKLGKSFDITLQRKTTQFRKLSKKQHQINREIKINNGSEKTQVIKVSEIMPAQEWSIRHASHDYTQDTPTVADFEISLPAEKETIVTYEVVVTYP